MITRMGGRRLTTMLSSWTIRWYEQDHCTLAIRVLTSHLQPIMSGVEMVKRLREIDRHDFIGMCAMLLASVTASLTVICSWDHGQCVEGRPSGVHGGWLGSCTNKTCAGTKSEGDATGSSGQTTFLLRLSLACGGQATIILIYACMPDLT